MVTVAAIPRQYWITREGWPFMAIGVFVALLGWGLQFSGLVWLGLLWTGCCALFFRNPGRVIPTAQRAIVSPADGRVVAIEEEDEPYFGRGRMRRVSIFLSVANVHMNRMPVAGRIEGVQYCPGKFMMAFRPKASSDNERNAIWVKGERADCVVVQIAGLIARRIVSYLQSGDVVERGMRCGLIRFGSRVDVYVPLEATLNIQRGDCVRGGSSILGYLHE
jgi:phosphatidylserine decarboxylase